MYVDRYRCVQEQKFMTRTLTIQESSGFFRVKRCELDKFLTPFRRSCRTFKVRSASANPANKSNVYQTRDFEIEVSSGLRLMYSPRKGQASVGQCEQSIGAVESSP